MDPCSLEGIDAIPIWDVSLGSKSSVREEKLSLESLAIAALDQPLAFVVLPGRRVNECIENAVFVQIPFLCDILKV
jgi:hypothetical protein